MLHELLPRVVDECGFTATEVGQLMRNAFDGAWISHEQRTSYHHEVDNYLAAAPS
jgi:adenosine deaminase